ncbi:alkaline phosphatase family protein [Halosimplex marinum]|uniref:alkaline phosphatase family protein n=1 Tax=Halosimplex marinum TaxID=3396620 RepID=UPI003F5574CD
MDATKTVVFGLDGAHFELIEPWIEAGELPNVASVVDGGVSGDLESVLPPVTSPNWKAYATGKNPGKLGIFWWENVDVAERRVHYPSDRKHRHVEFWDLIADEDPVGVLGTPTTYPPSEIEPFFVAGPPDGKNTDFAYPPEIETELTERFDYRVRKRYRIADDEDRAVEEILDLIDLRFEAARHLAAEHPVAFLQVTTFYLNSLHHFLWDDEATLRAWRIVDEHLGAMLADDCNVVLMSDHGSHQISTVFHVNTWLQEQGYLTLDETVANALHSLGINTDRLVRLATSLGVRETAERLTPQRLLNYIPDEQGEVSLEQKTEHVDWDRTRALASGQGPVYLTLPRDHPEYERTRSTLVEELEGVTDPDGRPVARAVHRGEDVYSGEYVSDAPDIVVEQAEGVHIHGSLGRDAVFTAPAADGWSAENKREGLFAAAGPDFATGEAPGLSILDLAPTLLHLHDCAVPASMDGEVRTDLFDPDSDPAAREVAVRSGTARERELERIRGVARRIDL